MSSDSVAKRYAQALFELGEEHDQLETFEEELQSVVETFESSDALQHALLNPGIELDERHDVIRTLAERGGLSEMTRNFLFLLLDNDRIDHLPTIVETYRTLLDESRDRVRATITSAVPLDRGQTQAIKDVLEDQTGKSVVLSTEVDESLIGGAVTRIGSLVYDGSVRSQLDRLKDNILEETA